MYVIRYGDRVEQTNYTFSSANGIITASRCILRVGRDLDANQAGKRARSFFFYLCNGLHALNAISTS